MLSSLNLKVIGIIALVIVVGIIGWRINHAFNEAAKVPGLKKEVALYKEALRIQSENFIAAKKLTQKVSQNYENLLSQRDADFNRVQRKASTCVIVQPSPSTNRPNATDKPDKQNIANGIFAGTFFDFSRECETDRAKVIGLQEFIKEVYQANGSEKENN